MEGHITLFLNLSYYIAEVGVVKQLSFTISPMELIERKVLLDALKDLVAQSYQLE
jgi:hypothetical protein